MHRSFLALLFLSLFALAFAQDESTCCPIETCSPCNCDAQLTCPLRATDDEFDNNPMLDTNLWAILNCLNPQFSPLVSAQARDAWAVPGLSNKHKAFTSIVNDITNALQAPGTPLPVHIGIARRYGASDEELSWLFTFVAPFVAFPKIFATYPNYYNFDCSTIAPTCPDGECQSSYTSAGETFDSQSFTDEIADQLMVRYAQLYSEVPLTAFNKVWRYTGLSLKSKLIAVLTSETAYRAMPSSLIQFHIELFRDNDIISSQELEAWKEFSGLYTGYTKNRDFIDHRMEGDDDVIVNCDTECEGSGAGRLCGSLVMFIIGLVGCVFGF